MKDKKEKNNSIAMGIIGLLFLASSFGFFGYVFLEDKLNLNSSEGTGDFSSIGKPNPLDNVNEHLRTISDKLEIQRMKTELDNMRLNHANHSNNSNQPVLKVETAVPIVDFSEDPRNRRLAEEMGRTSEVKRVHKDPRSVVYNDVIADRQAKKQEEDERKRQAKEFVANARKDGWIVTVDENFKIKSYRRAEESDLRPLDSEYKGFEVLPK